ncbi:armadillo repeat-containing protein gudu isoform X1 [Bombus affinis]|uniref:Armadillo repeat-containing protein gudu isoform X1 n=2 Tax=Bombus terrestris TaxID=30195 RepID=A0A9C6SMR7_BOMTE|nr:armadillo repeat-containing protein gudu isoform X1 [Bombus terrestris]XP_048263820.1 armadillo repeat-containing protein gudu isoform X1 [Bombus terrestris]XP_048263821.1 armadillo repeat-containing protein gudu isoform X1 [Bombus terrestris]XP_048263822.1 armadillo repeat-containing protein gudu isoform X1 [Bombus terrestris]XP_048263823.1 armadillo repeat-containing protein gudu isoform X1 [Bombus terrestris]XP_048263824.1 armadillo repeat-containing protein gudu isoform X1 [Bombus terre
MPPKRKKDVKKISIEPPPTIEPDMLEVIEPEEPSKPLISAVTGQPFGPRVRYISEKQEEESTDDEPESESDDEVRYVQDEAPEVPSEFWHIQKLIRYMKAGNQTATMVAVCLLKDYDLTNRIIQKAIREMGGLEILVNLLETRDLKCQNGSLSVLLQIVSSTEMRRHLIDLGIVTPLIQMLKHPARDIQVLAAETMAIVARIRKARKQIRIRDGIPLILDVMDVPDSILRTPYNELNETNKELVAVAIGCAKVLDSLSSSPKVRDVLHKFGVVKLMERFLKSHHTSLVVPMMGAVQQCAIKNVFRKAFETTDIICDVVRHLQSDNIKLKENCALAIFKCGTNKIARDMVRQTSGLDVLCKLLQCEEVRANKQLLAAVTGGIWKCAISPENVIRFNQNGLVAALVPFLEEHEDDDVQANVVGALAECCKDPVNRDVLRINDGLPNLIKLLSSTYEPLLENIPLVIKECAQNEQCMDIINDPEHINDGVRLVWSLLKHPSDVIKRNSCLALVSCIKYAKDSPEMVRAFVGGLELTVSLLESTNTEVLSAVCATIAGIATDPENLGILSDHGVVEKLANLVPTENEDLRANLTLAIAHCCEWGENNAKFGRLHAVAPLIDYMTSKNTNVLRGVCIAAYHLSKEPMNCITMHSAGVIKHVLRLVGSNDPEVQIAAACTIRNIRKLALTAEKLHFKEISTLEETDYRL